MDPRLERLFNDPEWLRSMGESARKLEDLVARAMDGDEAALAELQAGKIDVDALRAKYL